ncbi:MAG: histidine--tRNA ligase [Pseudomonadota bacterium]|nr:histidine--tRNA ligase [Pseudomonadota bacterium]
MSPKLQPVRGTHDILPEEARKRRFIEAALAGVCERYNYGEIATPVFEFSDVFHRTLGDTSDVVTKETYTFTDRGGESLTLRPEFTAGVVRAFISNGLQDKLPFKVYYHGPAFRYERPQKGRLRQFHQFGAELVGEADPLADAEMIAMSAHALSALGLLDHVKLELNSLGDAESRQAYRGALVAYFKDRQAQLSEDSKQRLERNPLRILDSKDEGDRRLIIDAPQAQDYFTPDASAFFDIVQEGLEALNIKFEINPRIVRGLDYYSHTVFEFTTDKLGAQGTVLAGGRYDGLVKLMGGPDVPGVGFAAGIERLLALMEVVNADGMRVSPPKVIAVIPIDAAQEMEALKLADALRHQNFTVELITRGNMGKKMKKADKLGATAVLLLGEDEVKAGEVTLRWLATGEQQRLPVQSVVQALMQQDGL